MNEEIRRAALRAAAKLALSASVMGCAVAPDAPVQVQATELTTRADADAGDPCADASADWWACFCEQNPNYPPCSPACTTNPRAPGCTPWGPPVPPAMKHGKRVRRPAIGVA